MSKYKIELSSDKIDFQFQLQDNLLYCIEIKKGLIAAVCETNIKILSKKNKIYKLAKTINSINTKYYDLQIKNNEFFILFSFYNNVIGTFEDFVEFFDIETLESIKKVKIEGNSTNYGYLNMRKIFIIDDYLIFAPIGYQDKIIMLSIKTKEIVQYFQIQFDSLIFIKNAQIIQVYQRCEYGYKMANLKIEEGLLDYFDEKESKIIQKDESSTKIKCFGTGTIQEIYYMDDNEALYDLGSFHSERFGILNNA